MPMKSWLDETQKEKGEKEKEIKRKWGREGGEGTWRQKKGGISPLRSLWQESAWISRGPGGKPESAPWGRRVRRRSPGRGSPEGLHFERLAVSHQSHCGCGDGVNAEPSQVAFSGKNVKRSAGGEAS